MLLVDSGNFSDVPTREGDIKTDALIEAMGRLGYQVVNVGEREVRLGYDEFAKRIGKSKIRFVSANLVDQETQEPIFPPHAIVDVLSPDGKAKRQVGVIGILRYNPLFQKSGPAGKNMVIRQPTEVVAREVAALRKKNVDLVVLLSALHKDDAKRIAEAVRGIDYVVGAYGGIFSTSVEKAGGTTILYSGNQGKRLGEQRIFLKAGGVERDQFLMHFLTSQYPTERRMLDFVNSVPVAAPSAGGPARPARSGG